MARRIWGSPLRSARARCTLAIVVVALGGMSGDAQRAGAQINFATIIFATIIIEKRAESENGDLLVGACFRLDGTDPAPDYPERCDDDDPNGFDGETVFTDVEPGVYTVIETVTPAGYASGVVPPFAVTPGETRTVTVVNQLLPTATATSIATMTSTNTPTESPTNTPTESPTNTPTSTPTSTVTQIATPTDIPSATPTTTTDQTLAAATESARQTATAAAALTATADAAIGGVTELPDTGSGSGGSTTGQSLALFGALVVLCTTLVLRGRRPQVR